MNFDGENEENEKNDILKSDGKENIIVLRTNIMLLMQIYNTSALETVQ